ncbi:hypothetical protein FZD47_02505 [Bacillus infantis]|uniref:IraD/Gp25-like domain-containing protein n=1 Tax=Bacillus infantis TaxID=324767 RepID=A0A5D4SVR7_9BACI|nr:hypothetical protein [Bacillus infantis]TYS66378.1 hypothetical protein FZD47_02505 [Bacillus infantis]
MINLNQTKVIPINFGAVGEPEILQNLRTLFSTPEGTVPFDRKFGIKIDVVDGPIPIIEGRLMVEYMEKAEIFEPRVKIENVTIYKDEKDGSLFPSVEVSLGT